MPITVTWHDETQSSIVYKVGDSFTIDDLYQAIDESITLLDTVSWRVNLIIDMSDTVRLPSLQFPALYRIAHAPTMYHPNTGSLYIVGLKQRIGVIFRVFKRVFPDVATRYRVIGDIEKLDAYPPSSSGYAMGHSRYLSVNSDFSKTGVL